MVVLVAVSVVVVVVDVDASGGPESMPPNQSIGFQLQSCSSSPSDVLVACDVPRLVIASPAATRTSAAIEAATSATRRPDARGGGAATWPSPFNGSTGSAAATS